jgi:hypothetical protein
MEDYLNVYATLNLVQGLISAEFGGLKCLLVIEMGVYPNEYLVFL